MAESYGLALLAADEILAQHAFTVWTLVEVQEHHDVLALLAFAQAGANHVADLNRQPTRPA